LNLHPLPLILCLKHKSRVGYSKENCLLSSAHPSEPTPVPLHPHLPALPPDLLPQLRW
jgi:hypothetical protein